MIAAAQLPEDPVLATISPPFRILFVGHRNAVRSPIAESLMVLKGKGRFEVASAGVRPAERFDDRTLEVLDASGLELHAGAPRSVQEMLDREWDMVFSICERGREECPTLPRHPLTGCWGIANPASYEGAERSEMFRRTVQYLSRRIDLMLALPLRMQKRIVARTQGLLAS